MPDASVFPDVVLASFFGSSGAEGASLKETDAPNTSDFGCSLKGEAGLPGAGVEGADTVGVTDEEAAVEDDENVVDVGTDDVVDVVDVVDAAGVTVPVVAAVFSVLVSG